MLGNDERYIILINDNPMPSPDIEDPVFIRDDGNNIIAFKPDNKEEALDKRDELRERYDNPDINAYRITLHGGQLTRDNKVECHECGAVINEDDAETVYVSIDGQEHVIKPAPHCEPCKDEVTE